MKEKKGFRILFYIVMLVSLFPIAYSSSDLEKKNALEIELSPPTLQKTESWISYVSVKFSNNSNKLIKILRHLDGSEWCWHMPYYKFDVTDRDKNPLKLLSRCLYSGLWGGMKWPDEYVVEIRPKESFVKEIEVPFSIPSNGEYNITLSYIFSYDKVDEKGIKFPDDSLKGIPEYAFSNSMKGIKYPDGLWEGAATSKPISLKLKSEAEKPVSMTIKCKPKFEYKNTQVAISDSEGNEKGDVWEIYIVLNNSDKNYRLYYKANIDRAIPDLSEEKEYTFTIQSKEARWVIFKIQDENKIIYEKEANKTK